MIIIKVALRARTLASSTPPRITTVLCGDVPQLVGGHDQDDDAMYGQTDVST